MKNKLIVSILIVILVIGLCACKKGATDSDSGKDFSEYTKYYNEVLDKHYNNISDPKSVTVPSEGELGVIEACKIFEDTSLENIGYSLIDINNDEVPELVIGSSNPDYYAHVKNEIYALYGLKNNIPTPILEGNARNIYSITNENKLYNYGSNNAMNTYFASYIVSPSLELEYEHYYFTNQKSDNINEIGFFHNIYTYEFLGTRRRFIRQK